MDSKNRLKNKWVLITGATSGIGKAAAVLFAETGANLIITGRRNDRLQDLKNSLTGRFEVDVITLCFDVRERDECKKAIDKITHPVHILLNNAGLAVGTDPVYSGKFDDWDRMIDTNIKGLLTMTRFISAQMKERNEGHIINIGSIAGHEAYSGGVTYAATKHAVNAITKATKMDLHGTNVRVSAVSPGLVDTEFSEVRYYGDREKADQVYEDMKPLAAEDIAEVILFVANRPPHVNIMDTIVFPVQQSAATMVHRSSDSLDE